MSAPNHGNSTSFDVISTWFLVYSLHKLKTRIVICNLKLLIYIYSKCLIFRQKYPRHIYNVLPDICIQHPMGPAIPVSQFGSDWCIVASSCREQRRRKKFVCRCSYIRWVIDWVCNINIDKNFHVGLIEFVYWFFSVQIPRLF